MNRSFARKANNAYIQQAYSGELGGFPKFNGESKFYALSNLNFILSHKMLGSEPRDARNLLFLEVIEFKLSQRKQLFRLGR